MTQLSSPLVKELITIFKEVNIVKFGSFILKDGSLSRVYIDLRILSNFPKEFKDTAKIMANYIRNDSDIEPFDGIIAPPLAGIPLGVALALELKKEFYLAREKPKKHGTKKLIEGNISEKRILIVDDVFTTGVSKTSLLKAIRDHGGIVNSILVVINRTLKKGKLSEFEKQNRVKVHYLISLEDLF
ncbi:MAG: orotate phosphoribosyltransferase [Candidatus Hodarchaeota archaeon]